MKIISIYFIFFFTSTAILKAQNEIIISRVFNSEKQNAMASKIPGILLEAFSKGEIVAYYPKNANIPVNFVQMLHHFGASQQAEDMLNASPWWYCESSGSATINTEIKQCFSQYFEIGELKQINHITKMPEKNHFIRLIYASDCSPDGFERQGPVFKIKDIAKLDKQEYRLMNPRNAVYKYKIIDYLRLRTYSAR